MGECLVIVDRQLNNSIVNGQSPDNRPFVNPSFADVLAYLTGPPSHAFKTA